MNNLVELKIDLNELFIHTDDDPVDFNEALADAVISRLADKLYTIAMDKIDKKLDHYVKETFSELLNAKSQEILNNFLEQPVKQTDRYGDVIAHFGSVKDMVKEEYNTFITKPVDSKGEAVRDGCGYGSNPNIEHLIKTMVKKAAEKHCAQIIRDTDNKIKNAMTRELKAQMADDLAEKIISAGKSGENK